MASLVYPRGWQFPKHPSLHPQPLLHANQHQSLSPSKHQDYATYIPIRQPALIQAQMALIQDKMSSSPFFSNPLHGKPYTRSYMSSQAWHYQSPDIEKRHWALQVPAILVCSVSWVCLASYSARGGLGWWRHPRSSTWSYWESGWSASGQSCTYRCPQSWAWWWCEAHSLPNASVLPSPLTAYTVPGTGNLNHGTEWGSGWLCTSQFPGKTGNMAPRLHKRQGSKKGILPFSIKSC